MSVHFTQEFLNDLRETQDVRFVREVLNHTVAQDGSFTIDRNDHRHDGIKDGWIRYVSRGRTAYRVIFIRKGPDVFLYRAGIHAVEDNLKPPKTLSGALQIAAAPIMQQPDSDDSVDSAFFLKTAEARFISRHLESMYHVRHKEIYLVSPFIDLELLESRHKFGRFLDRAIEDNTSVVLITTTDQDTDRLPSFRNLEERGISVFFLSCLHTKLYMFDVDPASRTAWQQGIQSHVIIGSSNLTNAGLGFIDGHCNEELNCKLPGKMFEETRTYVTRLMVAADDYTKYAFKIARNRR